MPDYNIIFRDGMWVLKDDNVGDNAIFANAERATILEIAINALPINSEIKVYDSEDNLDYIVRILKNHAA